MKKVMQILGCLAIASGLATLPYGAWAQTTKAKSKTKAPAKVEAPAAQDDDDIVPDVGQSKVYDYKCELGNVLTMYTNVEDDKHVAMRWKKHLFRLTRVDTSTGAQRFENKKAGLVWIGIPAKSLLLDSKHGQQLANECHTDEPISTQFVQPETAPTPAG